MRTVGIRELRQNPAPAINEAKSGGIVEILERGKPVARIVPLPGVVELNPYERMLAEGLITPAAVHPRTLLTPRAPEPGKPTLTETLLQMREEERY